MTVCRPSAGAGLQNRQTTVRTPTVWKTQGLVLPVPLLSFGPDKVERAAGHNQHEQSYDYRAGKRSENNEQRMSHRQRSNTVQKRRRLRDDPHDVR